MKYKIIFFFFSFLLFIVNVKGQETEVVDSLIQAFEVNVEPIELIYHPIQKHFLFGQNKLEINQSSRELAATFDDPSRVLYRHAGISMANDQNNSIVYRGLPSEFVKWSIDGAEIVNPNHLSNAGRLSDQSSPSAGGVLAIPFEVVNKFSFYGNAYSPEQVSSLSAVSDFNFDMQGDNFFKVGLLGMEAGFQTKGKIKVKGDFRYSTVGLLSDFGVNFDGESIKFYDGFLKADVTDKLSIIAIAGNSTNFHEALTNIDEAAQLKDLQEIDFKSRFFITGITFKDEKNNHSLFVSKRISERSSLLDPNLFQSPDILERESFYNAIEKYAYNGYRNFKVYKGDLRVGLQYLLVKGSLEINEFVASTGNNDNNTQTKLYTDYKYISKLGDVDIKFQPGLAAIYNNTFMLDPSVFIQTSYHNFLFELNYAIKHVNREFMLGSNFKLPSDRMESYSASLKYQQNELNLSINTRLFYLKGQTLDYLSQSTLNGASIIDVSEFVSGFDDIRSKGIELMLDKSWKGGWYTHINTTFFNAEYLGVGINDLDINTNENFKNIYNFILTKEFKTKRNNKWIVNLAYHQRGGAYQINYDEISKVFTERRLSTYYRIDARFQYNWNTKNTLTLDIQNLTNNLNDGYYFFDAFQNQEVLETQLGTIPILSYKRVL